MEDLYIHMELSNTIIKKNKKGKKIHGDVNLNKSFFMAYFGGCPCTLTCQCAWQDQPCIRGETCLLYGREVPCTLTCQ